jgi:hypothetical protein
MLPCSRNFSLSFPANGQKSAQPFKKFAGIHLWYDPSILWHRRLRVCQCAKPMLPGWHMFAAGYCFKAGICLRMGKGLQAIDPERK